MQIATGGHEQTGRQANRIRQVKAGNTRAVRHKHTTTCSQAHADTNVNITKQIHTNMSLTKQGQQVRTTPSSSHA